MSFRAEQFAAAAEGSLQGRVRLGRIQKQLGNLSLTLNRKTDDAVFFDSAVGGFLGGGNHKIADGTALDLGSAPHHGKVCWRDARLDAGGSVFSLFPRSHIT